MILTAEQQREFWDRVANRFLFGCWPWIGNINPSTGYGRFWIHRRCFGAHRIAYELGKGAIKPGMTIDHLCRNRKCVNPEHLEQVTNRVNVLRGEGLAAQQARKTHCVRGHELSGENLSVHKDGKRYCRECGRQSARKYYRRDKLAALP